MLDSVFITGGSRGIGEAMVRLFAEQGFRVAFTYLNSESKALEIASATNAHAIKCDVSSFESVKESVKIAQDKIGDISVLINNAGICQTKLFCDLSESDWKNIQSTNTDGMFYTTNAILPMMLKRKSGRIINISSVWGVYGASCETAYSTSKAACIGLTKSLAKELAPSGITVTASAPGVIDTDMNKGYSEDDMKEILADIPMGRMAQPSEVAQLALFLASKNAEYITGQIIGIDGGFGG